MEVINSHQQPKDMEDNQVDMDNHNQVMANSNHNMANKIKAIHKTMVTKTKAIENILINHELKQIKL
jgi:uncharacterized iron-regulated protein